jgi:hypothetical protein
VGARARSGHISLTCFVGKDAAQVFVAHEDPGTDETSVWNGQGIEAMMHKGDGRGPDAAAASPSSGAKDQRSRGLPKTGLAMRSRSTAQCTAFRADYRPDLGGRC